MYSSILLFLNIGGQEMIFIFIIALFLFGGKKLPELARGLGKGIREFKDASDNIKRDINDQINDFEKDMDRPKQKAIAENVSTSNESSVESSGEVDGPEMESAGVDNSNTSIANEEDISHSDEYYQQSYDYVAPDDYANYSTNSDSPELNDTSESIEKGESSSKA